MLSSVMAQGAPNVFEGLWSDFSSFYSQFYEVITFESTYVINEGKMQSVYLYIELRL
jgi:hypothetical protein